MWGGNWEIGDKKGLVVVGKKELLTFIFKHSLGNLISKNYHDLLNKYNSRISDFQTFLNFEKHEI